MLLARTLHWVVALVQGPFSFFVLSATCSNELNNGEATFIQGSTSHRPTASLSKMQASESLRKGTSSVKVSVD
jgi:hypothetical protein